MAINFEPVLWQQVKRGGKWNIFVAEWIDMRNFFSSFSEFSHHVFNYKIDCNFIWTASRNNNVTVVYTINNSLLSTNIVWILRWGYIFFVSRLNKTIILIQNIIELSTTLRDIPHQTSSKTYITFSVNKNFTRLK